MRIAVIGAGNVGSTLGKGWMSAGHSVAYGLREPGSVRAAVVGAEVVVLTTPWDAVEGALAEAGDLEGKPLLDVTNPIGPGFELALGHTTSGAERVATLSKNARVVKAFNTTGAENMANPRYGDDRVLMPVAGDDAGAVAIAARLATDLGFEALALAGLTHARELEPLALLWIKLALKWGQGRAIAFGISRRAKDEPLPALETTKHPRAITIAGTGHIGGALARGWLRAGHRVRLAARDAGADDVKALVALGATTGSASDAEVVVLAVPAAAAVEVATSIGVEGKIVVDCTNAIGKGFTLQHGHTTSSSEELAKALRGAKVIRSFNQQGAEVLQNPSFGGKRATNFVAGDDPEARALVRELTNDLGLDGVEAGPLASSRYLEPMTPLWLTIAKTLGTRDFGIRLMRR